MTTWGKLLDRKSKPAPEPLPMRYYIAERAGRLFGRFFSKGDMLKVSGQPDLDPAILREVTEGEWQERVIEAERRLAEMFPEAERSRE